MKSSPLPRVRVVVSARVARAEAKLQSAEDAVTSATARRDAALAELAETRARLCELEREVAALAPPAPSLESGARQLLDAFFG